MSITRVVPLSGGEKGKGFEDAKNMPILWN